MRALGGAGSVDTAELVKTPVGGSVHTLQMLLGTSCLNEKISVSGHSNVRVSPGSQTSEAAVTTLRISLF